MLEQLRKSGASVFIYLIFGLLIVIFVINFAPNAGQGGGGCMGGSSTPITVNGEKSNLSAYRVAYAGTDLMQQQGQKLTQRQRVYYALELLIRKELLAQAAESRGIRVTRDLVEKEIRKGIFYLGGNRVETQYIPNISWMEVIDKEKFFMLDRYNGWVGHLNVSQNAYLDEQARAMQASMMADILKDSVSVSRDEAKENWLFEKSTATYDLVSFSPADYRDAMRLTDADLARYLATHEAEVKKKYADEERTYKATKPALKLRSIFIASHKPEAAPAPGAGSAAAPAPATQPTTPTIDQAKAKLEAARTAIAANKQKFAEAAKQLSSDAAAKATGGELGWRSVENPQLGDKAVNDAVKTLEPGTMTPVITTDAGAWLVMAEEKREGDLSYDQVKNEIAAELAKELWSKEAAKRAALDALAAAKGGKTLEQLFPKVEGDKMGALAPVQKDVLAAWRDDQDPATGAAGGAGSSPAPAAGSGSAAAPAPAAGSGSAAAPAAPAAPAPVAAPEIAPSSDVLPAFGEVKPQVMTMGPTSRRKELPGLGDNKEAIAAVFETLNPGDVAPRVYEDDGKYIVVQLKAKSMPAEAEFDKVADEEITKLRQIRGMFAVEGWLKARCEELAKDGRIKPMADLIRETDDAGKPLPTVYQPCMTLR